MVNPQISIQGEDSGRGRASNPWNFYQDDFIGDE